MKPLPLSDKSSFNVASNISGTQGGVISTTSCPYFLKASIAICTPLYTASTAG